MNLAGRKRIELQGKLNGFQLELAEWRRRSRAHGQLEKHHSQIRRITNQLESLDSVITARLDEISNDELLRAGWKLELMTLELHRIWDFFRSKFALRYIDWFSPYLSAADEVAWQCYKAAQEKVDPASVDDQRLKGPPLVFFSSESMPFTLPRKSVFRTEEIDGEQLDTKQFLKMLQQLPIPIIGIPWLQAQHLPGTLIIGHEVGHDVEFDFNLTKTLESLINESMARPGQQVELTRRKAWRSWAREVFADIYANLAFGPAFVAVLIDFLVVSEVDVSTEARVEADWGRYPTTYLRILIGLYVLKFQDYAKESDELRRAWTDLFPHHGLEQFEEDIPTVIGGILRGPYPQFRNSSLTQVISFPRREHEVATVDASRMLEGYPPESDNVRTLFSSAAIAFGDEPIRYRETNIQEKVLQRVSELQQAGVIRGPSQNQVAADTETYDKNSGERLFSFLSQNLPRHATHKRCSGIRETAASL